MEFFTKRCARGTFSRHLGLDRATSENDTSENDTIEEDCSDVSISDTNSTDEDNVSGNV